MLASTAPYLAVMDADLQHDETILPEMLRLLRAGDTDIVIGSRYLPGGDAGTRNRTRASMTAAASSVSRLVCKHGVSDPMSGFFMLRRETMEQVVRSLSGMGFKILLDILASAPGPLRVREVPYTFRERFSGESKLDTSSVWEYGMLLADKMLGRRVPVRFMSFSLVGAAGVVVHLLVLTSLLDGAAAPFPVSQMWAAMATMVFNYCVNNALTYRDMRLHGWRWLRGLATFMLACGPGAVANVGVASYLFSQQSGAIAAALGGIAVGAVWNYVVTAEYPWRYAARMK
jgi:dolichol-phosphate mannosyltransferase